MKSSKTSPNKNKSSSTATSSIVRALKSSTEACPAIFFDENIASLDQIFKEVDHFLGDHKRGTFQKQFFELNINAFVKLTSIRTMGIIPKDMHLSYRPYLDFFQSSINRFCFQQFKNLLLMWNEQLPIDAPARSELVKALKAMVRDDNFSMQRYALANLPHSFPRSLTKEYSKAYDAQINLLVEIFQQRSDFMGLIHLFTKLAEGKCPDSAENIATKIFNNVRPESISRDVSIFRIAINDLKENMLNASIRKCQPNLTVLYYLLDISRGTTLEKQKKMQTYLQSIEAIKSFLDTNEQEKVFECVKKILDKNFLEEENRSNSGVDYGSENELIKSWLALEDLEQSPYLKHASLQKNFMEVVKVLYNMKTTNALGTLNLSGIGELASEIIGNSSINILEKNFEALISKLRKLDVASNTDEQANKIASKMYRQLELCFYHGVEEKRGYSNFEKITALSKSKKKKPAVYDTLVQKAIVNLNINEIGLPVIKTITNACKNSMCDKKSAPIFYFKKQHELGTCSSLTKTIKGWSSEQPSWFSAWVFSKNELQSMIWFADQVLLHCYGLITPETVDMASFVERQFLLKNLVDFQLYAYKELDLSFYEAVKKSGDAFSPLGLAFVNYFKEGDLSQLIPENFGKVFFDVLALHNQHNKKQKRINWKSIPSRYMLVKCTQEMMGNDSRASSGETLSPTNESKEKSQRRKSLVEAMDGTLKETGSKPISREATRELSFIQKETMSWDDFLPELKVKSSSSEEDSTLTPPVENSSSGYSS